MRSSRAARVQPAPLQVAPPVDPGRCPLCGTLNECAMEAERANGMKLAPCWCSQVRVEAALLARVPERARDKACLCAACARGELP